VASQNSVLIFIPDISGFTEFIKKTEIEHSKHIIKELLEIVIDSNEIELEVSEIEGDAVLFYRFGDPPSITQMIKQCKNLFIRFHEHLKLYERDRICKCGACSTANSLTLKVLVHYGKLSKVEIKEHHKLLGEDLIVAHRLLKNHIVGNEYVLLTDKYLRSVNDEVKLNGEDWVKFEKGMSEYPDVGVINYQYFLLTSLHKLVKDPPKRTKPEKVENPLSVQTVVEAPIELVHEIVSNADYKPLIGKVEVKYDQDKIPRIGSRHECILPNGSLYFETTENLVQDGRIEFWEKVSNFPILGTANIINILTKTNCSSTHLTIELHYKPQNLFDKVKYALMKIPLKGNFLRNLASLKKYAENNLPGTTE